MPCIKVPGGYKIRRKTGGLYPKVYSSKKACEIRVGQMESHKNDTEKKKARKRIKERVKIAMKNVKEKNKIRNKLKKSLKVVRR
jgi:hypothetical protein